MVLVLVTLFSVSLCPFVFLVVHTGGVEMSYSGMAADITNVHGRWQDRVVMLPAAFECLCRLLYRDASVDCLYFYLFEVVVCLALFFFASPSFGFRGNSVSSLRTISILAHARSIYIFWIITIVIFLFVFLRLLLYIYTWYLFSPPYFLLIIILSWLFFFRFSLFQNVSGLMPSACSACRTQ